MAGPEQALRTRGAEVPRAGLGDPAVVCLRALSADVLMWPLVAPSGVRPCLRPSVRLRKYRRKLREVNAVSQNSAICGQAMPKRRGSPTTRLGEKIDLYYPDALPIFSNESALSAKTVGGWRTGASPTIERLKTFSELTETPLVYWAIDAIEPVPKAFIEASVATWCLRTLGAAPVRRPAIGDGSLLVCEPDPGEIERAAACVERRLAAAMQIESGQELVQKILECADVAVQLREAAEAFGNQLRALQGRPPDE